MPNLVTVVGHNTTILPHMLKHYEDKVEKMYVVVYRQHENDGILEEIEELGIKPYKIVTEPKFNWNKVTDLYNEVKLTKPNDWWIVSDDDELQVYPESIEDITKHCDKHGYSFVTGGFLDRLGIDGTFPVISRETDILKAFPLGGFFRYPLSGACPNKVTLMKGHQKVTSGQHYALFDDNTNSWGKSHPKRMPIQECFTQVHHFKWDSTCIDRIKEVADNKKEYSYSKEYKKMYDSLKAFDFKVNIKNSVFKVVKLKESSYIKYTDYKHWNSLTKLIIKI